MSDRKAHWESVYQTSAEQEVSWFEPLPAVSLQLLDAAGLSPDSCVLDVGGGDSRLVDALVARGLECLAVLDLSRAALERAQERLGPDAASLTWIEADVTGDWSLKPMDIWHDRAVFHFLTGPEDRRRYVAHLRDTLKVGGAAIVATFALDGPEQCSGLPVARYSPGMLAAELGDEFRLVEVVPYAHQTPRGSSQSFIYSRFTRVSSATSPLMAHKDTDAPSLFQPETLVREAQRQRALPSIKVPRVCVLDPDGDIVRWLTRCGQATKSASWACYHSEMYECDVEGTRVGIVGCAVGAPFAVLVAEQMFACGCELFVSITSSGQIAKVGEPPYFVLVTRALRDEGTSHHYLPAARFVAANPLLITAARAALESAGVEVVEGAAWTTDAPFRETASAVAAAEREGILAVEMESAALYAFALAKGRQVICVAHVTNTMGASDREFEKWHADGATEALGVIGALARLDRPMRASPPASKA